MFDERLTTDSAVEMRRRLLAIVEDAQLAVEALLTKVVELGVEKRERIRTHSGQVYSLNGVNLRCPTRLSLHRFMQIPIGLQPHPQLRRCFQQSCKP